MVDFIDWGERIESVPEELASPQLLGILHACEEHPDFRIVELRLFSAMPPYVGIVVDVADGTIEPKNDVGIMPRERLCISYRPDAHVPAEVRALRKDFPEVVHLDSVEADAPASLCLYEDWGFEERRWTPRRHLGRILWWLRETSRGSLHAQDQALEQLFYANGHTVVLPAEFQDQSAEKLGAFHLSQVERPDNRLYLIASIEKPDVRGPSFQPLMLDLPEIENLPVQHPPRNLGELSDQLQRAGSALQPNFDVALKRQFRSSAEGQGVGGRLLLIVRIPRARGGVIERIDSRGFLVCETFENVGIRMGALFRPDPNGPAFVCDDLKIGGIAAPPDDRWRSIPIEMVDLRLMPSRKFARTISGIPEEGAEFAGVLAGVGSLGSAMADIWGREGWGRWTFIDPDEIAPHNLVRHVSTSGAVGFPKAQCVRAHVAQSLGQDRKDTKAICSRANDEASSEVAAALEAADLLVDASTTIEVPRDWSEREMPRSASTFVTHSGMSAVLLIEDQEQRVRLSALEAQYYRAIICEPWGEEHLQRPDHLRVGAGCRDHSVVLSYELIKLHAAQLARRLRKGVETAGAAIFVWTLDDSTGGISAASVPVHQVRSLKRGDWDVRWDEGLREKLHALREANLPSETGGVLVGVIDQKLRTMTVVDASAAPADSDADATGFTRGTDGSEAYVSRCAKLTGGMVGYIGEWHSHPDGHSASPSTTDAALLATLTERLAVDGVPALMVIVSADDLSVWLGD